MLRTSVRRRAAVGVAAVLTLAAVGAGVARARAKVNFFTVHSLVSDRRDGRRRDGRVARQRLGPQRRPDDAVVDVEQRHEHLDALQRRRHEGRADRRRSGRPDGHGVQRQQRRLRRQPERQERRRPLPVRDRGRDDPRLDADGERARPPSIGVDRSASGAVYKGLAVANDRLYATDFHNGRVDVFDASFNLSRPRAGSRTRRCRRASRRSASRRSAGNIFVTYAKQDAAREGRRPGARAGVRRRVHARRAARRARGQQRQEERAAERAVGPRDGAGRLRRRSAATCSSATSATAGSAPTRSASNGWVYKGQLRVATARRSRSTGSGRSRSATAPRPARRTTLYFLAGPSGEKHGLFGSITVG